MFDTSSKVAQQGGHEGSPSESEAEGLSQQLASVLAAVETIAHEQKSMRSQLDQLLASPAPGAGVANNFEEPSDESPSSCQQGAPAEAGSFRLSSRRVSFDMHNAIEKMHLENDMNCKSRADGAAPKDKHNSKQELKKISKLQSDEVYGMSDLSMARQKEVMARGQAFEKQSLIYARRHCLLLPQSRFRLRWDGTSCLLILLIALLLPYRTAFVTEWSLGWTLLDFLIDVFFLADIVVNLRTMYVNIDGELVTDSRKIFIKYAKSWLILDIVASIPIEWFRYGISFEPPAGGQTAGSTTQLTRLLRIFRLLKLLRLLRVARLFRYLGKWERMILAHLNSNIIRLLKLLSFLVLFSHWNGCIQYTVATLDLLPADPVTGVVEIHPETWIVRARIVEEPPELQWSWCFYHAMTQLLAISVGVVPPRRPTELWAYLVSILLGAALYAIFVASLTAVFSELGASGREYRSRLDMLHQYMRNMRMPLELRNKMQAYFELCFPDRQMFDETVILNQLSHPLQSQVLLLKCNSVLTALRVVHDENLARVIALYLERVVFIDEDYVIRMGEVGRGMYFISNGTVEVFIRGQNTPMTTLGQHAFFGEMALLEPGGRATGDVRVKGFCEGYHLSRKHFNELLKQFPDFKVYIENVARLRLEKLAKDSSKKSVEKTSQSEDLACQSGVMSPIKRRLLHNVKEKERRATLLSVSSAATALSSRFSRGDGRSTCKLLASKVASKLQKARSTSSLDPISEERSQPTSTRSAAELVLKPMKKNRTQNPMEA